MIWKIGIIAEDGTRSAVLEYDWDTDSYVMHVNKNTELDLAHIPFEAVMYIRNYGVYDIPDKYCRLYISQRVIPAGRQNIGDILRNLGVGFYHECFMLRYMPRSAHDNLVTEFISGEDIGLLSDETN